MMNHRLSRPLAPALLVVICTLSMARAPHSSGRRTRHENSRGAPKRPELDISKINDPGTRDPIGPHSHGEAVIRAEILLDRLKFSPGEIGDSYEDNLAKAIAAFQAASGLPAIGSMDGPTWAALNDDQAAGHVEQKQGQAQPAPPPQPPPQAPGIPSQNPAPPGTQAPRVPPAIPAGRTAKPKARIRIQARVRMEGRIRGRTRRAHWTAS